MASFDDDFAAAIALSLAEQSASPSVSAQIQLPEGQLLVFLITALLTLSRQ
jgi:hypothetical protein